MEAQERIGTWCAWGVILLSWLALRLNRQLLTAFSTVGVDLDSFDAFNFLNIDTFDSWRSSPENSVTYSSARLARALPLSDA